MVINYNIYNLSENLFCQLLSISSFSLLVQLKVPAFAKNAFPAIYNYVCNYLILQKTNLNKLINKFRFVIMKALLWWN